MPYTFTAAPSSRISKPKSKNPLLKRSLSSPFDSHARRKPIQRTQTKPDVSDDEELWGDRLEDVGLITSLAEDLSLRDVAQIMKYTRSHMFDEVPERAGMNSTRIAEVLNFRKSLPPIVTNAQVHAFTKSPSTTEREMAELTRAGVIRRIVIPGRGTGASSSGEGLVLVEDWQSAIEGARLDKALTGKERVSYKRIPSPNHVSEKYLYHLKSSPLTSTIPSSALIAPEATTLMRAGFLTSSSPSLNSANVFNRPDATTIGTMTSLFSISKAASGSMAAIGGEGAVHGVGGGGSGGLRRGNSQDLSHPKGACQQTLNAGAALQFALPSTGPFLRLLIAARSHLMSLLTQSRYREVPLYLMKERWDGGIASDDPAAKAKKYRGEFVGILPGRTRKWKQYYGLNFDWILAECLGAGLIEVFETGSVGRGIRAV
ncbi:hypothetical protein MMC06_004731 [Schaereria dolodes]|nr:hypothetical protein [Schaereria dolodes]